MTAIDVLPFGETALSHYLAIAGAPDHLPEPYLRQWLSARSPFLGYGQGEILLAGDEGGLIVTLNPKVRDEPFAAFAGLTLDPRLTASQKTDVTRRLLAAARRWGRERGVTMLRGPLLFSTWHPYRVMDPEPRGYAFPGERVEPSAYQAWYRDAGLIGEDEYCTQAIDDLPAVFPAWPEELPRMPLRSLAPGEIAANLAMVHQMVTTTFERNAYYAHIEPLEFGAVLALDQPGSLEPLSTAAVDDEDRILGFAVGYGFEPPDGSEKIAVLKTLGVLPEYRGGVVTWNVTVGFHEMLMAKGYRRVYHAMMKADNKSRSLSGKYGVAIRRYRLFSGPTRA